MRLKKTTVTSLLFTILFAFNYKFVTAQEPQPPIFPPSQAAPPQAAQEAQPQISPAPRAFFLFPRSELREKYLKEQRELTERQRQEKIQAQERYIQERKEARKRYEQERKDAIEKRVKEREAAQNKLKAEQAIQENISTQTHQEALKNKVLTEMATKELNKEIKKVKKVKRTVEVVTNENDPLYIFDASVLNAKTQFLGIKHVELKYKIVVHNQTPKIINSALIQWERKIPFGESQAILKETKISAPITPYEKRVIEYNDLDSTRQGELYKVKIANIIFEDGTQWKNPAL